MSLFTMAEGDRLLVAGRGLASSDGLHEWRQTGGNWSGRQLASVEQLAALVEHPVLPVVYGVSGIAEKGWLHAWQIGSGKAERMAEISSRGLSPCHVAIDPGGTRLVVTNYRTSAFAIQRLAGDGNFDGGMELHGLTGSGPDPERQNAAHPHQALFVNDRLFVIDLGADMLREFAVEPDSSTAIGQLRPVGETALPAGHGPRHGVALPDGRFAISGELGSSLLLGRPGTSADEWIVCSSTERTGAARTRSERNYPGDIRCSADGRFAYFANRGHDTITTFDLDGAKPEMVSELDAGVKWPQHLLVCRDHLLIAGWDSSRVVAMPLDKGMPGPATPLFDCPGAGWLLVTGRGAAAIRTPHTPI